MIKYISNGSYFNGIFAMPMRQAVTGIVCVKTKPPEVKNEL